MTSSVDLLSNPYSGLLLTIGAYAVGQVLYDKTRWAFLQPVLTASVIVIVILSVFDLSYRKYYDQNAVLNYILPLTAVVLALPLYRNRSILKKHGAAIFAGIIAGTVTTMGTVAAAGIFIGTDFHTIISLIPKSATNPIAFEVSRIIGGIPPVTVALVVITGVIGGVAGPEMMKLMGIKNQIARGIAMGSISHAIGTARSLQESELQGSMSSLAMALAGMLTAILAPLIVMLL